ncbi:unnamed protein product [Schistosoma mattheei]|uniref:Uncharacterized protein n=1 Tax=Schistosoma mattheei TaxID=31246 RepID=A0A183P9X1_9TREM|nr:unnamed protein product [Schistosoma mattheei]
MIIDSKILIIADISGKYLVFICFGLNDTWSHSF